MTTTFDEIIQALDDWFDPHSQAARSEGWCIFLTLGSDYGPIQVMGLDERLGDPDWISDGQACKLVREGAQPHHVAARELLAKFNPKEPEIQSDNLQH
jgi:hypothetical protein